jgi:hypothetical protein
MKTRLNYLDHLRVFLVTFVILHHVAVIYGAAAPFYYLEPPYSDFRAFQALLVFVLVKICLTLIVLFRRFFNGKGRLGSFLSQSSYSVYFCSDLFCSRFYVQKD